MEYNSQRGFLRLKEYGRHIQNLVEYAISIPEKEKRQDVVDHVIHIMGNLNPHLKNVDDFKHLLWDHLHIMAGSYRPSTHRADARLAFRARTPV